MAEDSIRKKDKNNLLKGQQPIKKGTKRAISMKNLCLGNEYHFMRKTFIMLYKICIQCYQVGKKLLKIFKNAKCTPFQICEWTMFVRCPFIDLKPKIRCSSSISKRWTRSSILNVGKNDVLVRSMSNSANLVMGYTTLDVCLFEAKNRVFEFDHQ